MLDKDTISNLHECKSKIKLSSVTRFGDLLNFGQLFNASTSYVTCNIQSKPYPHYAKNCLWHWHQDSKQCDQIWRFIGLWPTFKCFWQQTICPNLPHSLAFFVKVSKSIIFLVKSFLGNFYRHLAIFIWSQWIEARLF